MRNLKPIAALVLTGIGSALVATFQVAAPQVSSATTSTASVATTGTTVASTTTGTTTTGSTASASPTKAATSAATSTTSPTSTASPTASSAAAGPTTAATATATASPTTATPTVTTAQYADGTYNGAAVQEPWGTFEVQATISAGRLVNVTVVSAPSDGHSSRINSAAVPLLTQSAIATQSAQIDAVSGATWTSQSYMTSLQAALDAAHAAAAATQTAG